MKKIIAVFLSIAIFLCLTSCRSSSEKTSESTTGSGKSFDSSSEKANESALGSGESSNGSVGSNSRNIWHPIYNKAGEKIGEIEHFGFLILTEEGIVYGQLAETEADGTENMDYFRYDMETKEHFRLGRVTGWALQSSQTAYVDGHLFMFVCTGDISSKESRVLKLLDINVMTDTMTEVFSETGGSPADTLLAVGNRVLIVRNSVDETYIEEYDIKNDRRTTRLRFRFDNATLVGNAVRHIAADEETISLLMLVQERVGSVKLRIDVYDHRLTLLRSIDVSDLSTDPNERRQIVQKFVHANECFYYENFSSTRFLGKTGMEGISKLIDTGAEFSMANELVGVGQYKLFYQLYNLNSNAFYLLNTETGTVAETTFYAEDTRYYISNVHCDSSGAVLIHMDYRDPTTGERLEPRLYYLTMEELGFH
ncbi:MAG: hypothetical protein E7541_05600 [Ruminococcaceae bacterium]|nr:hypothetical protein [Oscillospiraceae bacterium]